MGSSRLPGKVLMPIKGRPLIGLISDRLALRTCGGTFVIATTTNGEDDLIASLCAADGVPCFRGHAQDVLDRYYRCALQYGFTRIVRLTGDNPFVDIGELDRLVALQQVAGAAFCHSLSVLPVGVGAEIFTFEALERSHREGTAPHHREHVDEYLLENPERFTTRILEVPASKKHPDLRLTIDTPEDYRRVVNIAESCVNPYPGTEELIAICSLSA